MASIIIIGGGYGGSLLARKLDSQCDVTLIEPRDAFIHNVAAMRAVTAPKLLDRIVLPYDRLLKRGRVVRDRVTGLGQSQVALASGRVQKGDVIVVATGSRYAAPFKPQTDRCDDFCAAVWDANKAVREARHVAIVGAGAVGVELAGEIASSMPGKTVTLIGEGQGLFPDYTGGLGRRLEQDLRALGVHVIKGMRIADLKATDHPSEGPLSSADGKVIDANLVIPTIGARFDNTLLRTMPQVTFDSLGRANVDAWLRLPGSANIFALGDAAANGDKATIVAVMRQCDWLAKHLVALSRGSRSEKLPPYRPYKVQPILVPVGPARGASVLPFGRKGLAVGAWFTSTIKGKGLFVSRYRRDFRRD